jgi:biotin carboxylase
VTDAPGVLPRLALVYGGSGDDHSPLRFAEAADGVCSLVWVIPPGSDREDRATLRFLARLGVVVDAADRSSADAAAAIGEAAPDGIVCLVDRHLGWTAEIAELRGLRFHRPATARRLTDKLAQRAALRDRGLPTPEFWDPDELADDRALREVAGRGLPLVLKPRHGTSSRDTERIDDEGRLSAAVATARGRGMLLEGYIPDPVAPPTGPGSAPYVSVELLVRRGVVGVLGITGRTPLAPPFRETGFLFPADVPPEAAAELADVATAAALALGVEDGALHVEIKFTDDGPVVIEVNGRPGGHAVHPLLRRALGIDTVRLAMRVAVGEHVAVGPVRVPDEVVFRFDVQPDAALRTITAVEGLDGVRRIPGVEQVVQGVGAGDEVSWRNGTLGYAAAVLGAARDHAAVSRIRDEVLRRIVVSGVREETP